VKTRTLRLVTCIGVDHDLALLPHFVDHYQALGITGAGMIALLNTPEPENPRLAEAQRICTDAGVVWQNWIAPYTSDAMWRKRREIQAKFCSSEDWVISADVDEFHQFPERLPIFLDRCEALGANVVQGVFVDRIDAGGRLRSIGSSPSLAEQFPLVADAMGLVGRSGRHHNRFGTVKLMAIRGGILPERGGHDVLPGQDAKYLYRAPLGQFARIEEPDFRFAVPTRVNHYRWTGSLVGSLRQRLATPGVSVAGEEYGLKQLAFMERNDRFDPDRLPRDEDGFPRVDWEGKLRAMRRKGAIMSAAYKLRLALTRGGA